MISAIEWVPKGVADPKPRRHELSQAEAKLFEREHEEMMKQMEEGEEEGDDGEDGDNSCSSSSSADAMETTEEASGEKEKSSMTATELVASQKVDTSTLPADLRMDEYSDDEEEGGANVGRLLMGDEEGGGIGIDEEGRMDKLPDDEMEEEEDNLELESEEEEELGDIPDTREYAPTDIEGLQCMTFSNNAGGPNDDMDDDERSDDSDRYDTNLQTSDALILSAHTDAQEEFSTLEVHVYEPGTGNLFVHHDIPLPAYPLALAHGTVACGGGDEGGVAGNFVAVGTFEPGIEVWNLDVLDVLEPTCVLGGEDVREEDDQWARRVMAADHASSSKKKKKKKKKNRGPRLMPNSHTDAVISLSWSQTHRHILASGSADHTVRLWDCTTAQHAATFTHHTDKVSAVSWHPTEGTLLATGAYDRNVCVLDARVGAKGGASGPAAVRSVRLEAADCEAVQWDSGPGRGHFLTAADESGNVSCWDVRKLDECYWKFQAHDGACSDIAYNPNVPGMLATCSIDKTVALWDTYNCASSSSSTPDSSFNNPVQITSKEMNVGQLFTVSFYPSTTCLLACGGKGGELALWDLEGEQFFQDRFASRLNGAAAAAAAAAEEEMAVAKEEEQKVENFEATMMTNETAADAITQNSGTSKKKNKKKKKKKPNVHRKGR